MKLYNETIPAALRPGSVAPALGALAAGVCPQVRFRGANDAGMATGHRPWSPLIT